MAWQDTRWTRRLGVRLPLIQAPMAGGWTTPQLVAAVSTAGALGSIAGAMLPPDELRAQIRAVRSLTVEPFAVNLFAPTPPPTDRGLAEWARLTDRPVPVPPAGPRLDDQLSVVASEKVPVFSVTFGLPPLDCPDTFTMGTATTVAEARALQDAGVDAVVAQGAEAGGHRGSWLAPVEESLIGTMALVPQVVDALSIPVIASGGIMDGRGIVAARSLGAQAVQLGTAFLASAEAGTPPAYREALGRPTSVTRVLTGRPARAVRTPLVARLEASGLEPPDYPLGRLFLSEPPYLAGQGGALARALPAGQIITTLAREAAAAAAELR